MTEAPTIKITRETLAAALAAWEAAAAQDSWPARTDADRHLDSADWLIAFMQGNTP